MHKSLSLSSVLALLMASACGGGGGSSTPDATAADPADADTSVPVDAAPRADAAPLPDAMPAALDCIGAKLPNSVANPPIVIAGTVQEGSTSGINPMTQSAHVAAHLSADDGLLVEGDFTGDFTLTDPTDSATAIDAYLAATSNNFIDTYVYPPYPIYESLSGTPIIMVSTTIFGLLPILTGVTQTAGNGVMIVAVTDCNQDTVEGAVVTITPSAGTIKYAGSGGIPGMTDFPSTQSSGVAYIFNVPPGNYTIGATVGGMSLRDNAVKAFADANTTLVVAP